jgi:hypothetical protein
MIYEESKTLMEMYLVLTWPPYSYSYSYEHLKFGVLISNGIDWYFFIYPFHLSFDDNFYLFLSTLRLKCL